MNKLTLIMAMTPSGIIGIDGKIPWKVSEDLKRFKALTTGHAIIMGRKTWDSIGKPLPNRRNIVLTRSMDAFSAEKHEDVTGIAVCLSIDDAIHAAYETDDAPFVIGGAEIYEQTLERATHLEVTYVVRDLTSAWIARPVSTPSSLPLPRATRVRLPRHGSFESRPWQDEAYPSLWDWRCTKIERAIEHADVEFHSFERRT